MDDGKGNVKLDQAEFIDGDSPSRDWRFNGTARDERGLKLFGHSVG